MTFTKWQRVSRARPCPICGRPDWCLIAQDGSAAICPRSESNHRAGDAGYLHRIDDGHMSHHRRVYRAASTTKPSLHFGPMVADFIGALDGSRLQLLAARLGVTFNSLLKLRVGWSVQFQSFSFPMTDASGLDCGIRLRRFDGSKFAIKGSREGLFVPDVVQNPAETILICEGASDVSALLDMGFVNVIGRPSCTGGTKLIVEYIRRHGVREVVIVADADAPGRRGAENLASMLRLFVVTVKVIVPPDGNKDARAWLLAGGTRTDVEQLMAAAQVQRGVICAGVE